MVIQADEFNRSLIGTVICVQITTDLRYVKAPGNVLAPASGTGLPRDTVINVAHVVTFDRRQLSERVGLAPPGLVDEVNLGLLKSLGLAG
jgi:mRNA interferase MazF